jgi:Zn-dependent peptidase ImmA (M78 family)
LPSRTELEERARQTLVEHGLYAVPVDPVVLARRLGILVNNAKFSDESLSALLTQRGESVRILVNASDPPYRKRFSIGHEIGHHLLHLEGDGEIVDHIADLFRDTTPAARLDNSTWHQEVEANQFAAALLMPAELVREEWERNPSVPHLARRFNVSEEALAIRLDTLALA